MVLIQITGLNSQVYLYFPSSIWGLCLQLLSYIASCSVSQMYDKYWLSGLNPHTGSYHFVFSSWVYLFPLECAELLRFSFQSVVSASIGLSSPSLLAFPLFQHSSACWKPRISSPISRTWLITIPISFDYNSDFNFLFDTVNIVSSVISSVIFGNSHHGIQNTTLFLDLYFILCFLRSLKMLKSLLCVGLSILRMVYSDFCSILFLFDQKANVNM